MTKKSELSFEQAEDLGLKYVRDLLEPVCPYGVKRLRAEGFYAPEQRDALERELDNVALLRAALDASDRGQAEAARTLGFSAWSTFRLVTLPQVLRIAKPVYQSTIVNLIQWTSVVGYVMSSLILAFLPRSPRR